MTFQWTQEYSVGVPSIDEQHKVFFRLLDELNQAIFSAKSGQVLEGIFNELSDYAKYHFSTEERYFIEYNFEGALPHIAEHRNYIKRLEEIHGKVAINEAEATKELLDFMEDWMVHHIDVLDKQYTKCFVDHGLK